MMLEAKSPLVRAASEPAQFSETSPADLLDAAILFVRRRHRVIGVVTFLALAVAILYLTTTPPAYTAAVDLILGKPENQFIPRQSGVLEPPMDAYNFENQIQIARSDNVANQVVRRLHLDSDPEFVGAGSGLFGPLVSYWRAETPFTDAQRAQQAMLALEKNLDVSRVGMSFVMDISYAAMTPEKAALIANAIAEAFIAEQRDVKLQERRTAGDWLLDRANELRQQTETAERAVTDFKKNNNIVAVTGGSLNEQQVTQLTAQLAAVRQKTAEALARVNQLASASMDAPATNPIDATASIDTLANPTLTRLRQKYLDLAAQERDLSRKFGANSGAVSNLHNQMADLRQPIADEIRRLGDAAKSDYEAARERQGATEKDLAEALRQSGDANRAQGALQQLESVAHNNRLLYDSFIQRSNESLQAETFPLSDARVISPALPPQQKSRPKSILALLFGAIGGLALGVGIGLLRDLLDATFRTGKQVETALRLPCIALVPRLTRRAASANPARAARPPSISPPRMIQQGRELFWTVAQQPASQFAEDFRSLKFALDLASATNGRKKIVGFTSALPNEGKSSVSTAFGLLVAQIGARAIVVDLDLRNPSLSRALAPNASLGLVDVLTGRATLEQTIWIEPTSNMAFLPVSASNRLLHTTEILSSAAMKKLFIELHQRYEYVIVDMSPLVPVVDARATTEIIDNYFLVVEWGRTKTAVVLKALDSAPTLSDRFVGAILNKSDIRRMARYELDSKTYYNNPDFARYGYTS